MDASKIKGRLLRAAEMSKAGNAQPEHVAVLLDAAVTRIEELEGALEPFAGAARFVAAAAPATMTLKFGFQADAFRAARTAYLGSSSRSEAR